MHLRLKVPEVLGRFKPAVLGRFKPAVHLGALGVQALEVQAMSPVGGTSQECKEVPAALPWRFQPPCSEGAGGTDSCYALEVQVPTAPCFGGSSPYALQVLVGDLALEVPATFALEGVSACFGGSSPPK